MTTFWIFAAQLMLVAAYIVWRHFRKADVYIADQKNMRGQTNKDLYHEHLREIEKDFAEGGIDEENFGYLKAELDRSLLQDMNATEKEQQARDKHTSIYWPVMVSLFIIVFTGSYYLKFGSYALLEVSPQQAENHPQTEEGKAELMISQLKALQKEVETNPSNSDAWFRLGQYLINLGEFNSAVIAFDKVIEIEGPQADVFALQAQAKYYQNNQQRNAEVDALLNKALAIDEFDATTLMLIGMDHYLNQRFAYAAASWQKIIDNNVPDVNTEALQSAINEAIAMQDQTANNGVVMAEKPAASTNTKGAQQAAISLSVSIADNIVNAIANDEDKTVFIYAIATSGPRMPLAAIKIKASDLPITVTLDDSKAMSPQMNLSSVEQVNVFAVISNSGQPGMKSGDYKGELNNIAVINSQQQILIINTIVQ